ncbi:MAG TPA: MFS transporter [Steroidobacteraceae bacterium]|nr:MFS transporter [Steroidobacteraceae bacterium]
MGDGRPRALKIAIFAHALLRVASSAGGVVVGVWLAALSRQGLPIHANLVGALAASAFGAELVSSVPLGVAADAVSVRWLMSAGALVGALAMLLFGLTGLIPVLFLSRLLEGVAMAAVTPPLLRYLARSTARDAVRRARMMSWFELSLLAGLALGGLVGTQLWARQQRGAFDSLALLYGLSALLLLFSALHAVGQGRQAALRGLRRALGDPLVRKLAPVWLCVNAIIGLWLGPTLSFVLTGRPVSDQYLDGIFATAPTDVGWLLLGYTVVFGTGVAVWGGLLPKTGVRRAMRVSLWAMVAVCAALALLNHSTSWPAWSRGVLGAVAALLIMIESGFGPAALMWLAQSLGLEAGVGAAMGIYSMLLSLGALAGSLLAGWAATLWRVDGLLLVTVLLAACALLFLSRMSASEVPPNQLLGLESDHGNP